MKSLFKFNNGYGAVLCHRCRKIIKYNLTEEESKKCNLLFCKECFEIEWLKWICLRDINANKDGRICYCGHTDRCDCANPDFLTFKDSVLRNTIKLKDPNNGWKKYEPERDEETDNSVD